MDNDHLDGNVHNINYTNAQTKTKTSCKTKKQSEGKFLGNTGAGGNVFFARTSCNCFDLSFI